MNSPLVQPAVARVRVSAYAESVIGSTWDIRRCRRQVPTSRLGPIQGRDLESGLGSDTLATLAGQTGMQYNDLLGGLSQSLPRFVDALTPDGRLMSDAEAEQTL